MQPQQRVCRCSAEAGPASWTEHRIQRILIKRVHEAEMQAEGAVWKLLLPNPLDEKMNALNALKAFLHLGRISRDYRGLDHRMKFRAFNAGRLQQPPVLLAEAFDLALNHAADRCRN